MKHNAKLNIYEICVALTHGSADQAKALIEGCGCLAQAIPEIQQEVDSGMSAASIIRQRLPHAQVGPKSEARMKDVFARMANLYTVDENGVRHMSANPEGVSAPNRADYLDKVRDKARANPGITVDPDIQGLDAAINENIELMTEIMWAARDEILKAAPGDSSPAGPRALAIACYIAYEQGDFDNVLDERSQSTRKDSPLHDVGCWAALAVAATEANKDFARNLANAIDLKELKAMNKSTLRRIAEALIEAAGVGLAAAVAYLLIVNLTAKVLFTVTLFVLSLALIFLLFSAGWEHAPEAIVDKFIKLFHNAAAGIRALLKKPEGPSETVRESNAAAEHAPAEVVQGEAAGENEEDEAYDTSTWEVEQAAE